MDVSNTEMPPKLIKRRKAAARTMDHKRTNGTASLSMTNAAPPNYNSPQQLESAWLPS
jgi:hypothetical protein